MLLTKNKLKVAFISLKIPEYKVWLYKKLTTHEAFEFLAFHGYEGKNILPKDIGRNSEIKDEYVKNIYLQSASRIYLAFQLLFRKLFKYDTDVIIMQDGVKMLSNYLVLIYAFLFKKKIIWYTHGENRQAQNKSGFFQKNVEKLRICYLKRADAIIAYTNGVKKMLIGKDIDENMIFVSSNTLNVEELIRLNKTTQISEINNLKEDLSLQGEKVITFVGRIVPEKKIEYFFQLFERLNQCAPHKYLGLIIGDGKLLEKHKKVNFEKEITNIKFLGRQSIEQTSKYLMFSDLVFIPGMTGLAIVHAFSFGVPYATLNFDIHSPEIEYLRHGVNGLLTMPETFVEDISALLTNKGQLQRMKIEALRTAQNELSAEKQLQGFIEAIHYVCN